jgi:hypothetical protein
MALPPQLPYLPKAQAACPQWQVKIPKKIAKVLPPKCAGCLFGAMTKLSWQGKETKANHKVLLQPNLESATWSTK